jgi:hypothetical protein
LKKGSAVATVRIGQANTSGIQNADEVLVFFSSACILSILNMSVGSIIPLFWVADWCIGLFFWGAIPNTPHRTFLIRSQFLVRFWCALGS